MLFKFWQKKILKINLQTQNEGEKSTFSTFESFDSKKFVKTELNQNQTNKNGEQTETE